MYTLAAAIAHILVANDERLIREEVLGALAPRRALIVFDRCDDFVDGGCGKELAEFLQLVLQRAPKVKLLLTSRKAVQLADFSPHIVSCSELSVPEAAALLKQMAPGTPKQHSETIAELCGCMPLARISAMSSSASSHCAPLAHAEMVALYEMTLGSSPRAAISARSSSAVSHRAALSHAEMTAL